jgi:hypothetical protein
VGGKGSAVGVHLARPTLFLASLAWPACSCAAPLARRVHLMALPVLTPPKVVTPTYYRRTRENGTAQGGRSFNPLLLFLITARPLANSWLAPHHRSPGVAAPVGATQSRSPFIRRL